jgi:hypothetical protein
VARQREIRLEADAPYTVATGVAGEAALVTPFGLCTGSAEAFQHLASALEGARKAAGVGGTAPPRPLYIPEDIVEASRAKAVSEFREFTDVVNEAFSSYMAGELEPRKPERAARRPLGPDGAPPVKKQATCSVRKHKPEWDELIARCNADKERLGWAVTPSKIATQYLMEEYLPRRGPRRSPR